MVIRILTLIVIAALVVAGLVLVRLYSRYQRRRAQSMPEARLWAALGTRPDGRATIVDFWTPACADCKIQSEELKSLEAHDVRVVSVDAARQAHIARAFGVFSAPSTAVLAPDGRLLEINRRLASGRVLQTQLGLENEATA